ncbi:DUF3293 domain-containing protein [Haliscomenobacter hydrossis]|uniref:DUF3293 domain-containing protein n=1 Tax=Haliscomenobacter hydrossis (strain ATCC 27775 / DSM 1100 / LMG 10767 / O) TaxID=760192 RepID=F4L3M7_HALH1|nr:DUF3293 domain-containing protein [Haliscomenobacter hydrossis]AEE53977.1 hypothetical protein Halhy_6155 [Haliscomenobacter hydrossis DSM 1100]
MDNSSIPIDERLLQAYLSSTYRVYQGTDECTDIFIGRKHPVLDQYLLEMGLQNWVFITAWNPRSQILSIEENITKQTRLLAEVHNTGLSYFPGEGIGTDEEWPPEQSLWVPGVSLAVAVDWGKRFEQNAVVWGELGGKAELVFCC